MGSLGKEIVFRESYSGEIDKMVELIKEFAIYVDGEDTTSIDTKAMGEAIFKDKKVKCLFIEVGGVIAGYMVYFNIFSTFKGRLGIYLEDLYVKKEFRGLGIGTKAFEYLKDIARENNYCKIEWNCLNTNLPAMDFYRNKLEASDMNELTFFTISDWNQ